MVCRPQLYRQVAVEWRYGGSFHSRFAVVGQYEFWKEFVIYVIFELALDGMVPL